MVEIKDLRGFWKIYPVFTCKLFTYKYNGRMIRVTVKEAAMARGIENSKQLADLMGCAPTIIWKIWTGVHQPKLPMLDRLCDALNCELSELLRREPGKKRTGIPAHQKGKQKQITQRRIKKAA